MVTRLIVLFGVVFSLGGCASTPATTSVACAIMGPYMPIRVSRQDTKDTQRQVLLANTAHQAACL